jgi:hypothetical protein
LAEKRESSDVAPTAYESAAKEAVESEPLAPSVSITSTVITTSPLRHSAISEGWAKGRTKASFHEREERRRI